MLCLQFWLNVGLPWCHISIQSSAHQTKQLQLGQHNIQYRKHAGISRCNNQFKPWIRWTHLLDGMHCCSNTCHTRAIIIGSQPATIASSPGSIPDRFNGEKIREPGTWLWGRVSFEVTDWHRVRPTCTTCILHHLSISMKVKMMHCVVTIIKISFKV